jgi:hypothetical protein
MPTAPTTDYNANLPNDGRYEKLPSPDSAFYEIRDVEDSPVGGHQEQVLLKEETSNE